MFRNQSTIRIEKMLIQETGTYNQMYRRPYEAVVTGDAVRDLSQRIEVLTNGDSTTKISSNMVAGLSHGLFIPTATVSQENFVTIPNGWQERRLRFIMEVHVTESIGTTVYFFQGYTDHVGVSLEGSIDDQMYFFINSYIRINRSINPMTHQYRDIITESAQVVDGKFVSNNRALYALRPEDLFTGIRSNYFQAAYQHLEHKKFVDTQLNKSVNNFRSNRKYGVPATYLAQTLENYRQAQDLAAYGQDTSDILSRAATLNYEPMLDENEFIRTISNHRGMMNVTNFTLRELAMIDPTVNQRIIYNPISHGAVVHQVGQTEGWQGSNFYTQLATVLINSISSLMMEHMLTVLSITSTNHSVGGGIITEIGEHYQSVTTADMRPYINRFVQRLEMEVIPDVTFGGQVSFWFQVHADLLGETRVCLSINSEPVVEYVAPSFCDSITAPIVTSNREDFDGLVHGIEQIVNNVIDNRPAHYTSFDGRINTNI